MDFNRYCKHCGSRVKMNDGHPADPVTYKCICQQNPLTNKEVIAGYTVASRIAQLKAMHNLMCEANDESIYMVWIYTMPDCPSEEDFKEIALDDKQYNACFDAFVRLIAKEGNRY